MPQKSVPNLLMYVGGMHVEQVIKFNFWEPTIDSNLDWKAYLDAISTKILRMNLKYIFPTQVLQ